MHGCPSEWYVTVAGRNSPLGCKGVALADVAAEVGKRPLKRGGLLREDLVGCETTRRAANCQGRPLRSGATVCKWNGYDGYPKIR